MLKNHQKTYRRGPLGPGRAKVEHVVRAAQGLVWVLVALWACDGHAQRWGRGRKPDPVPVALEAARGEVDGALFGAMRAALAVEPEPVPALPGTAPPDLRVVLTADTGGISSFVTDLSAMEAVGGKLRQQGHQVRVKYFGPGAVTDGETTLFAPAGLGVEALGAFMQSPPFARQVVEAQASIYQGPWTTVMTFGDLPLDGAILPGSQTLGRLVRWTNAQGQEVMSLETGAAMRSLMTPVTRWELVGVDIMEVVEASRERSATVVTLARAWGEGSRRLALVRQQCEEAQGQGMACLLLDAGNAVDGYSFVDGQTVSLQRANDWRALQNAGVSVLSPGRNELLAGVEALKQEASSHGVALVSANIHRRKEGGGSERVFEPYKVLEVQGLKVAVVGLADPEMLTRLPLQIASELKVMEPREALVGLRELMEVDGAPDLVVLLTQRSEPGLQNVLAGVDVVFGGGGQVMLEPLRRKDVPQRTDPSLRRPFIFHQGWGGQVTSLDVDFAQAGAPRRIEHTLLQITPVAPDSPRLDTWTQRVQTIRQEVYAGTERIVIPDPTALIRETPALARAAGTTSDGLGRITHAMWQHLAGNIVRDRTGVDMALVRPLPFRGAVDGPMLLIHAMSHLIVPDKIMTARLSGPDTRALVAAAANLPPHLRPTIAGYQSQTKRLAGRPIADDRTYTLAITDQLARHKALAPILARAFETHDRFTSTRSALRVAPQKGKIWSLKATILDGLERLMALRTLSPDDPVIPGSPYADALAALLQPQGAELQPEWYIALENFSLDLSQYQNFVDVEEAYSLVPETRVTTANNFNFNLNFDASIGHDSPSETWFFRTYGAFGQLRSEGADPVELKDDLVALTELRLNALSLTGRGARIPVVPFANVLFDTEFTRLDEAQERQKELREVIGVVVQPPWLKELKGGLLFRQDFVSEDVVEFGLQVTGVHHTKVWSFDLDTTFDVRYYLPDGGDRDQQLGLTAAARSTLGVPLVNRLSLALFADVFVFRGKTERTSTPGANAVFGLTLKYDRTWTLGW